MPNIEKGYAVVTREWKQGHDRIDVGFPMERPRVLADDRIRQMSLWPLCSMGRWSTTSRPLTTGTSIASWAMHPSRPSGGRICSAESW